MSGTHEHGQIDPNLLDASGYSLEASLAGLDYTPLDSSLDTPDLSGVGSKRKNGGKDGDSPAPKRTRQSQSCDACRARKVKCDRPPPGSAAAMSAPKDVCSHCAQLNLPCTFDYKPKKRGPPNLYLRKMRSGDLDDSSVDDSPRSGAGRDSKPYGYDMPSVPGSGYDRRQSGMSATGGTLASLNSMQASALSAQGEAMGSSMGRHVDEAWDEALAKSVALHAHAAGLPGDMSGGSYGAAPLHTGGTAHLSSPGASFASPTYSNLPHNPTNPLENVIPRGLLYHVVDLFFDYVYPLTPVLHKPTFMRDLHSKREERPGQEEFIHMVFSIVVATLTQVPRSFVAMPRRDVKGLIERCYGLCRAYMSRDFDVLSIDRMVMMYFTTLCASIMGGQLRSYVPRMIFGAHCELLVTLGLCEERTYHSMNPISRELHRRIFWLAYGADRSSSSIEGTPLIFNEVDCGDVALPTEIDDEYLTDEAYLPQPEDKTPILSGFYYISQLWRLTAQLMEKRRQDRRSPPHGVLLQLRLNEVEELHERVMGLMDDCPEVLKLDYDSSSSIPYVKRRSSSLPPSLKPQSQPQHATQAKAGEVRDEEFNRILPPPFPTSPVRLAKLVKPVRRVGGPGRARAGWPSPISTVSPRALHHPNRTPQARLASLAKAWHPPPTPTPPFSVPPPMPSPSPLSAPIIVKKEPASAAGPKDGEEKKCQLNRSLSPNWDAHATADIRSLFLDPKSSKAVAKDAYLVQQANIYVSQQMTRLMAIQYRDELHALQQEELNKASSPVRDVRDSRRYSNTRKLSKEVFSEEEKEQVMVDLLHILQRIPIQVIAVNTLPLVSKVRFIASTLLDSLDSNGTPNPPDGRGGSDRRQRAQTYLWDFLKILSEIENLYSLNDDEAPR